MLFDIVVITINTALVVFIPFSLSWVVLVSTVEIAKRNTVMLTPDTTILGLAKPIALGWLTSCAIFSLSEWVVPRFGNNHLLFSFAAFGTCFYFTYQRLCKGLGSIALESLEQKRWRILASFLPAFTIMVLLSAWFSTYASS